MDDREVCNRAIRAIAATYTDTSTSRLGNALHQGSIVQVGKSSIRPYAPG